MGKRHSLGSDNSLKYIFLILILFYQGCATYQTRQQLADFVHRVTRLFLRRRQIHQMVGDQFRTAKGGLEDHNSGPILANIYGDQLLWHLLLLHSHVIELPF